MFGSVGSLARRIVPRGELQSRIETPHNWSLHSIAAKIDQSREAKTSYC
jgi:hypothetical protein